MKYVMTVERMVACDCCDEATGVAEKMGGAVKIPKQLDRFIKRYRRAVDDEGSYLSYQTWATIIRSIPSTETKEELYKHLNVDNVYHAQDVLSEMTVMRQRKALRQILPYTSLCEKR